MKVVSITIFAIYGVTVLLTNNVNFIKIFENTIGYTIASLFSPVKGKTFTEFINGLFKHNAFVSGIDYHFLFSVFRLDNFGHIIKDLTTLDDLGRPKYDFTFIKDIDESSLQKLFECVVMKNTIGNFCWLIFSSIATTLVSIKFLSKSL
jgi:hypothetical protein